MVYIWLLLPTVCEHAMKLIWPPNIYVEVGSFPEMKWIPWM